MMLIGNMNHSIFLIDGELVRMSLEEFLLAKGISAEKILEIEYIKAVVPRKEEEPSLHDDWVSAVDGSNPGFVLTGCYDGLGSEEVVVAAVVPGQALGESMDIMTALQLGLRKSLAHSGLARGLHEGSKVIEKHAAQLCVLAEDCNQSNYVKLVKSLCADHNVSLIIIPSAKNLGEWAGVSFNSIPSQFACLYLTMLNGQDHSVSSICILAILVADL